MKTIEQRFWEKVGPHDDPNVCWLWLASTVGNSGDLRYGYFRVGNQHVRAHRFSYEMRYGTIPEGMTIDHVKARGCTSTLCVNPAHLEPVTNRENILRGEGLTALNARKTHCPKGHLYDEDNTHMRPSGGRTCRACDRKEQAHE